MTLEDYVTAIEAGRQLKVHPETVKRLCRQGDLPAEKLHNTWLIRKEVLRGGLVCLNSAARFDKWNRAAVR